MIVWNGLGFLVIVIAFACLIVAQLLSNAAFQDAKYYETHDWPAFVAFLVAAPIVWLLGRHFKKKGGRRLIDPETNEIVLLNDNHSLFWIPMEYWGPILLALGIAFLFID